jgi:hypothetical protein
VDSWESSICVGVDSGSDKTAKAGVATCKMACYFDFNSSASAGGANAALLASRLCLLGFL